MGKLYNRPDEEAMRRVLAREKGELGELIIRLAWELGLSREEIRQLKWNEVSFGDRQVILEDRSIPMEEETAQCLERRNYYRGRFSEYVVNGDRKRLQLQSPSISRIVRNALDHEESLKEITLRDLRHDFIIRQLAEHDWPYVARISGMATTSMYTLFSDYMVERDKPQAGERAEQPTEIDEFLIWKMVQDEGTSSEGLALWMAWNHAMEVNEIIDLTWNDVDFLDGLIRLPDRDIHMDAMLKRRLQTVFAARTGEEDPHVLLTPASRRPYDHSRLSKATRTLFIKNGVETWTMKDIVLAAKHRGDDSRIIQLVHKNGSITRQDVMELLQVSRNSAYTCLCRLVENNKLTRVGSKYFLAGTVVPSERQYDVIREHLTIVGSAYRQEIVDLLHIEAMQCRHLLRQLVKEGKLVHAEQRYSLPENAVQNG